MYIIIIVFDEFSVALAGNLKRDCSMCIYACNYLKYNVESTEATLLDPVDLWGNNETNQAPSWYACWKMNDKMLL